MGDRVFIRSSASSLCAARAPACSSEPEKCTYRARLDRYAPGELERGPCTPAAVCSRVRCGYTPRAHTLADTRGKYRLKNLRRL